MYPDQPAERATRGHQSQIQESQVRELPQVPLQFTSEAGVCGGRQEHVLRVRARAG